MNTEEYINKTFNPFRLQNELIKGSLYIAIFEILKKCIIDEVRSFFIQCDKKWDEDQYRKDENRFKEIIKPFYPKKDNVKISYDTYYASANWLLNMGCINEADFKTILDLRNYRNSLAHEFAELLVNFEGHIEVKNIDKSLFLLDKIESWWRNIHISTTSKEFEDEDITDVQGSRSIFLQYIVQKVLLD